MNEWVDGWMDGWETGVHLIRKNAIFQPENKRPMVLDFVVVVRHRAREMIYKVVSNSSSWRQ